MKYCRPEKHDFELVLRGDKIVDICKNCRCEKIRHGATKRFNENVKDFGYESAVKIAGF